MKKYIIIATAVLFGFSSNAREEERKGEVSSPLNAPSSGVDCNRSSSSAELDINNVRAFILNGGDMWWDQPGTGNARYEIPKLDDPNQVKKNSLFAGSVWIGGRDQNNNNILVTAQTYRQSHYAYWPGPLEADTTGATMPSISAEECSFWNRHFKLNKSDLEKFREDFNAGLIEEPDDIPEAIKIWPGKNNPYIDKEEGTTTINFDRDLAPFVDVSGEGGVPDGNYDPLVGDYPNILGDQTIWWVMNDIGNVKEFGGQLFPIASDAIGLELETRAFAFQTNDAVNDMTFYEQILTNKGNKTLVDAFIGQWADPDLGNYVDDYVGCDVGRGLGICYNGDDEDDGVLGYGLNPPAIGIDFFQGPRADLGDGIDNDRDGLVDEGSDGIDNDGDSKIDEDDEIELIVMSKFLYYNNNSDPVNGNPNSKIMFYNYLRNIWGNGDLVMYDGGDGTDQSVGIPADFMFPGNTDQDFYWGTKGVAVDPWDEVSAGNNPADRRFLQSAGPFTLEPGQQNTITIGVVWCRAGSGGATGSIACLKAADDLAQELFDREFKDFNGPNPPEVDITELDQEIVMALTPATFRIDDVEMNTETYKELDKASPDVKDPFYRFQGYLIYQLKDETVSSGDLENTDQARLIAQCDKQDGISSLINYVNDGGVAGKIAIEMVAGEDNGVFHTLSIKADAFNAGKQIVNNKEYYYTVIAYGSNVDPERADRKANQYIASKKDIKRIVAIPRKAGFTNGGFIANSEYGTGIDVTAINGKGTGGVSIDYTTATTNSIVANNSIAEPTYEGGSAPITVKVYDPYKVKSGDFKVKLYSRLLFDLNESASFEVGDRIEAFDNTTNADIDPSVFDTDETNGEGYIYAIVDTFDLDVDSTIIEYIPEIKEVQYNPGVRDTVTIIDPADTIYVQADTTINGTDTTFVVADTIYINADTSITTFNIDTFYQAPDTVATVITLNKTVVEAKVVITNGDSLNGAFSRHFVEQEVQVNEIPNAPPERIEVFKGYSYLPLNFRNVDNPSDVGRTYNFKLHEYFEIEDSEGNVINSDANYRVSEFNEVLLREYGITVQMQHGYEPEFEVYDRTDNGFIEATLNVTSGNDWLRRIERPDNLELPFWLGLSPQDAGVALEATTNDPTGVYFRVANGSIAPYNTAKTATKDPSNKQASRGGPKYPVGNSKYQNEDLPNIDVIIDYDNPQNWTRVPVLQADFRDESFIDPNYYYNRSDVPSLKLEGGQLVSGGTGTGMSYFPGYAIDLDRGVRLNMMFSESKIGDPEKGNNLIWEPAPDDNGGKSYVYVMGTEYDPNYYEAIIDEAEANYSNPVVFSKAFAKVFEDVTWVLNFKRSKSQGVATGNYKIRVRLNHYFRTAKIGNPIPEYGFTTDGYVATAGDNAYLESLCDNFRVVPNPYYAYSEFENSQLDNRVRLTNLPKQCTINIFTLSGTRVKTFVKNDDQNYLDWNLLNETGLHVASGTYLIHIEAPGVCQKVVKFFGVVRPLDLDTF